MPTALCVSVITMAMVLMAPAAVADLTADDVWGDWKNNFASVGLDLAGQKQRSGNTLTFSGIAMTSAQSGSGNGRITQGQIVMTEQADGTVAVSLPAVMPIEVFAPDNTGGGTRVSMDFRQAGLNLVASGAPENLQYSYTSDKVSLESTGIEVNGNAQLAEELTFTVELLELSGLTSVVRDDIRRRTQDFQIASLKYDLKVADPKTNGSAGMSGQAHSISFSGQDEIPPGADLSGDIHAALSEGLLGNGTFDYAAQAAIFSLSDATGPSRISALHGQGAITFFLAQNSATYEIRQDDLRVGMELSGLPLPLDFEIAKVTSKLTIPLGRSGAPEDFALAFNLNGFKMSETLWGLFDPQAQLPRDPAVMEIDLTGKAELPPGLFSPKAATLLPNETIPKIETLDVNRLLVSAMGAELSGKGAFTFENPEFGPPQPSGAADFFLSGANGLIDKLIAIGLLPAEHAMAARMMMTVLAVPGDTPDTLKSKVEINDLGHVMANGQRIR